jgi:tRNA-dihydrouridine synthase B
LKCPVLANGNIDSTSKAAEVMATTGVRGLMLGRGAIRNPWLFDQIRAHFRGEPVRRPRGREVLEYIVALYEAVCSPEVPENSQVQKMKKYLNFIALGAEATGQFLHEIRRVATRAEFMTVCATHLDHNEELPLEPYPAIAA